MVKKIDHIGIAVRSIKEALPFYQDVLQLHLEGIEEVESEKVRVAFLKIGESKLELLEPINTDSPIAVFIEKRGEGIHHIALAVDSIEQRLEDMKVNGIRMINEKAKTGAGGSKIAFIHPKSSKGVLFELCEKRKQED
ncbi:MULTISPECIES: methylmalonyl-CoA epimerase [Bacillaceae]|uniref:methylmalonyl-CoA epimerase n=1 Tax=Bacillaceae TaxID=186817 RepID=UPI002A1785F4|nr:methylmalonyl-CoA epimerase [Cytobacillus sp. IB215316]MDX8359685.1 methylmalonyl-CoA epimerase [Cytobacillus sp. IB215316]